MCLLGLGFLFYLYDAISMWNVGLTQGRTRDFFPGGGGGGMSGGTKCHRDVTGVLGEGTEGRPVNMKCSRSDSEHTSDILDIYSRDIFLGTPLGCRRPPARTFHTPVGTLRLDAPAFFRVRSPNDGNKLGSS